MTMISNKDETCVFKRINCVFVVGHWAFDLILFPCITSGGQVVERRTFPHTTHIEMKNTCCGLTNSREGKL